jgi:formate hydrogenlyase subunit 6/NADH:ubiquinone oxidoreductase subunit I
VPSAQRFDILLHACPVQALFGINSLEMSSEQAADLGIRDLAHGQGDDGRLAS